MVRALASHQCGPGSTPGPGVRSGLSLLLVVVLAPKGFSPGTPVFPSPEKRASQLLSVSWLNKFHFFYKDNMFTNMKYLCLTFQESVSAREDDMATGLNEASVNVQDEEEGKWNYCF